MEQQQEWVDLLDRYVREALSAEENLRVEEMIRKDEDFRRLAEEHLKITDALKAYGKRQQMKSMLDEIHDAMPDEFIVSLPSETPEQPADKPRRSYWPYTAVAASVAIISVLATLFITQFSDRKHAAEYKALRRNVEQIQQSQRKIIADINEKEKPVFPGKYSGTGFLISPKGYIVTSYHVIREADSVYIENEKWGRHKVSVLHNDPENDISILAIETEILSLPRSLPYTVSSIEASLGEEVYTLGFPREDIVFGEGSVSALTGYRQNPGAYQVSVPVNPGNSGGPLLNAKGDLIGIISGLQTETSGAAFATKSSVLQEVISQVPVDSLHAPIVLPRQNYLRSSRVEQVKKWKDFVFMVRVYN